MAVKRTADGFGEQFVGFEDWTPLPDDSLGCSLVGVMANLAQLSGNTNRALPVALKSSTTEIWSVVFTGFHD